MDGSHKVDYMDSPRNVTNANNDKVDYMDSPRNVTNASASHRYSKLIPTS